MKKLLFTSLFSALLFASCSKDESVPEPIKEGKNFENGFFVLNEGSSGGGSVTFVGEDLDTVQQNIYAAANPEEELGLGLFLQSMFFYEDKAYIISNGSNLITVVDANTFELLGTVNSGLEIPRYGVVVNGKAYITNLASTDSYKDDYVAVINLEKLEVETTVAVNAESDYITEENGLLYIKNGTYGPDHSVSVFNPATNTVEKTIKLAEGLNSIEVKGNLLYALSSESLQIIDLNNGQMTSEIIFAEKLLGAKNLEVENNVVYFTSGDQVYTITMGSTEFSVTPLIDYGSNSDVFATMYGFEVEDDKIYIGDAGNFTSNGYVQVYSLSGELIKELEVGVGPNGFYFAD